MKIKKTIEISDTEIESLLVLLRGSVDLVIESMKKSKGINDEAAIGIDSNTVTMENRIRNLINEAFHIGFEEGLKSQIEWDK